MYILMFSTDYLSIPPPPQLVEILHFDFFHRQTNKQTNPQRLKPIEAPVCRLKMHFRTLSQKEGDAKIYVSKWNMMFLVFVTA